MDRRLFYRTADTGLRQACGKRGIVAAGLYELQLRVWGPRAGLATTWNPETGRLLVLLEEEVDKPRTLAAMLRHIGLPPTTAEGRRASTALLTYASSDVAGRGDGGSDDRLSSPEAERQNVGRVIH
jgi:hypothetical protein